MTKKPTIAVDFDSVLANTSAVAFDLICGPDHDYTVDDVKSWTWGFDEFGKRAYLNGLWNAWTLRPLEVPEMEENVAGKLDALANDYRVDVVTAHPNNMGITDGKREWLDHHNVPYEEFHVVTTDTSKATLGYDAYIDDKPTLPSEAHSNQTVYLRDHPWNRDASGEYTRISSIGDVIETTYPIFDVLRS